MQEISWHFSKVVPSRKNREAMQGEFFASNKNIAASVIREAIQNSIDAGCKLPVKIRIYFSETKGALQWSKLESFLDKAWPHYTAEGSGLKNCPQKADHCKFLVIEDFNTSGLNGDILRQRKLHGRGWKNWAGH
jgi:hypothetical protein